MEVTKKERITKDVTLSRTDTANRVVRILNKIAESRFDGNNAKYVNNMQPEMEFVQDNEIVKDIFNESVMRIAKRIKCYVTVVSDNGNGTYHLGLSFPHNWVSQFDELLETKIKECLVYMVIAHWLENVSPADVEYYMRKSEDLLHEVRHTCEMRNYVIHTGYNLTY